MGGRLVAIALVALLGGCAAADADRPSDSLSAIDAQERRLLDRAEMLLMADCMSRAGFEVIVTDPRDHPQQPLQFPYGIDDVAAARAQGFGLDTGAVDEARRTNPNQRYFDRLSPERQAAYQAALTGRRRDPVTVELAGGYTVTAGSDGCSAEAIERLYGDFARWFRARTVVDNLASEYQADVYDDPRFVEAVSAWADCMRGRGYDVADPGALRERYAGGTDELPAAVAEAECSIQTRMVAIALELERDHAAEVRSVREEVITEYLTLATAALPLATTVAEARS